MQMEVLLLRKQRKLFIIMNMGSYQHQQKQVIPLQAGIQIDLVEIKLMKQIIIQVLEIQHYMHIGQ